MKKFAKSHEWIEILEGSKCRMGISSYAVKQLGDIVFIEPKDINQNYPAKESLLILESVKAVGDVYAPNDLRLLSINPEILQAPEKINGETWLIEVELNDINAVNNLLNEEDYLANL